MHHSIRKDHSLDYLLGVWESDSDFSNLRRYHLSNPSAGFIFQISTTSRSIFIRVMPDAERRDRRVMTRLFDCDLVLAKRALKRLSQDWIKGFDHLWLQMKIGEEECCDYLKSFEWISGCIRFIQEKWRVCKISCCFLQERSRLKYFDWQTDVHDRVSSQKVNSDFLGQI